MWPASTNQVSAIMFIQKPRQPADPSQPITMKQCLKWAVPLQPQGSLKSQASQLMIATFVAPAPPSSSLGDHMTGREEFTG